MQFVAMFFIAFVIEACGVGWSYSVFKNKENLALAFGGINTIVANGSLYFSIGDRDLIFAATLGELLGMMVMAKTLGRMLRE